MLGFSYNCWVFLCNILCYLSSCWRQYDPSAGPGPYIISEEGFIPTGDISSLRTLTGLGQRSWVVVVVVVPRPGAVPPQGIGGREYIKVEYTQIYINIHIHIHINTQIYIKVHINT